MRRPADSRSAREAPAVAWQATYASLAMILVVFFVMLVSYSQVSPGSAIRIRAAVAAKAGKAAHPGSAAAPALEAGDGEASLAGAGGVLRGALAKANLSREGVLERTRSGWSVTLKGKDLFSRDRSVRAEALPLLRGVAEAAGRSGLAVRVEAFGPSAGDGREASASWADPALRAAAVIDSLEREGLRSPLSLRGRATARPGAERSADDGGDVTIALLLPEEAER